MLAGGMCLSTHTRLANTPFAYCYRKSRKPDPAISVDLSRLVDKLDYTLIRSKFEGTRIGELSAVLPIDMGLSVAHCPELDNWAHTEI